MSSMTETSVAPRLGFWDAFNIIVGIVVGTAIFKSPTMVFQNVAGPWEAALVWLFGGILSLIGAFCYAELATTYPRLGGDYEYLSRAYGPWVGFLFGWAQLTVVLTASIGAMAYVFADYGAQLWNFPQRITVWMAAAAILAPSLANMIGVDVGKLAQNILSVTKIAGLAAVAAAGFLFGGENSLRVTNPVMGPGWGLAMVFVLYAYGGWNDTAFVAAEVRDGGRNIPRALIVGITGVTVIYLTINAAYLWVLGFDGARATGTPAAAVLRQALGSWGGKAVSVLVMISALGAINGMILTGSRVYVSLGADHRVLGWLRDWNSQRSAPVRALAAQAGIAILLVFAVGSVWGHAAIDGVLTTMGLRAIRWEEFFGGFETLVAGSAPVFWAFFLLTGISLFVLRSKDKICERPFSVPLFPVTPIIFCATCAYMLYSSLAYARALALLGVAPVMLGGLLYVATRTKAPRR
jgi:APA family basic amino acid/polyamine antiporter